ncbi:uncharacterized protein BX664DRAFT_343048 [Halteromyces radiatus]|uniref:uncharacterized protein n=1 Tax=Halteromyces radiatus TaxID=101107 RepID=UPI002220D763|nr:uncharacterized protein BX664DRAFT_343048 [Halteromyces radiatus]KAI8078909.1 hypothetical protein BX664DRAFT_343048 [Halteromyces radiatus]
MSESNNFFGTPFPEQTERDKRIGVTDAGQFQPVWKQEARDEQGRRRFHGAFTGGFSAGYYNTVGSKEGWTPSQFVSSRTSRREQQTQRVEDYMDEEDLQELATSKRLVATEEFDTLGSTEKEMSRRRQEEAKVGSDNSGLSFLVSDLMNLVAPTQDSTGMKLLRKMGWKPGQGIGPRTSYKPSMMDDDSEEGWQDDSSLSLQQMTLAPKDTPIVDYQPKTNTFGLGYDLVAHVPQVAEMRRFRQHQLDQQQHLKENISVKQSTSSRIGFGVGVFEDENDDTMPYDDDQMGSFAKYHHTLYEDEDTLELSKSYNKRKYMKDTNQDDQRKKVRCSDGHLPLKGFHVSIQAQVLGKWYAPPSVPKDFVEMHSPSTNMSDRKKNLTSQQQESITVDARGAMLGEKPIEARSVFDYMSSKSKERLAQTAHMVKLANAPPVDESKLQVSLVPKDVAQLALRGFMPFGETPEKQARYRHYLETAAKFESDQPSLFEGDNIKNRMTTFDIPPGMTFESGMKELDEFIKAARIFRPISSMMSGRFTSSSSSATSFVGSSGGNVEQISFEGGLKTEEQWKKEKVLRQQQKTDQPKPELSQEAEAAAMNLFGPLTRTIKPFYPNRLLCKRFNVRNPHPDHIPQEQGHRTMAGSTVALNEKVMAAMISPQQQVNKEDGNNGSVRPVLALMDTQADDPALHSIIPKPSARPNDGEKTESSTAQQQGDEEDLNYERPAMDIFKAIFENSDDEEEEEEKEEKEERTSMIIDSSISNEQQQQQQQKEEDDDFIGPPLPDMEKEDYSQTPTEVTPLPETSDTPFRPIFTKREAQDTKIKSEQILVTPFQPRLSSASSSSHRRRHVSVSSESASSASEEDDDDDRKKHSDERKRSYSKDPKKKKKSRKSGDKKKKDDRKKKRKHHHREDRHRHRHQETRIEDDMSLWVEKKTSSSSSRRSRPEDLW